MYGPELESALRRQSLRSKPTTRDAGIRAPINNRIVEGASSIARGRPGAKYAEGTCLLLGDFFRWAEANFLDYRPTDSRSEVHPREPVAVNMFEKCALAQS